MRYERVARLGRGGMGVVDLARRADGTEVALKRITLHGSADEMARARQRISREAEVLTKLRHPNVVRSEEHTSELQSLMRISYAVFCLKKKKKLKYDKHYLQSMIQDKRQQ